jgi:integrase
VRPDDQMMNTLIDAHCAWLQAGRKSERTIDARRGWLLRAEKELAFGLVDAEPDELETFVGRKGWSVATAEKAFYHLNGFFEWGLSKRSGIDGPLFADNPMAGMICPRAKQGQPNPVSDEELDHVLDNAAQPYLTAVYLALGAGLRATELSLQDRRDVSAQRCWVREGKGAVSGSAYLLAEAWEYLREFKRGNIIEQAGGVADGRKMSARAVWYFGKHLDLPGVSLHRFRHKYAQKLRAAGFDIGTISKCLRHKHLSSTQVYVTATEAECLQAVGSLRLRNQPANRVTS